METKICPHCQSKLNSYRHAITPGLVKILLKVYKHVRDTGQNLFGMREIHLTHSEYGNFQKLRFHGLLARQEDKQWLVTTRGVDFLKGKISIPKHVETFRNKVIDHDEELVNIAQVMRTDPYFQTVFERKTQPLVMPVQHTISGQTVLFQS